MIREPRLTRLAIQVNLHNLALGHTVFQAEGATFVRNSKLPLIHDANFVFAITTSESTEIDRLLARAKQEYQDSGRLTFHIDPFTPPSFEARLAFEEYERSEALVLVLEGEVLGRSSACAIRPITDEVEWQAYAELKNLDWNEHAPPGEAETLAIARGLASSNKLKCPPVQYVLAYEKGEAVGYCNAWEGLAGVGQIEDVFVHPAYRHRGIATAMIHHSASLARARGAREIVILVDPANTAKRLYSALGWRPAAVCRQYGKSLPPSHGHSTSAHI